MKQLISRKEMPKDIREAFKGEKAATSGSGANVGKRDLFSLSGLHLYRWAGRMPTQGSASAT